MKTHSRLRVQTLMVDTARTNPDDLETDNQGQLIIYTGIYRWADGSYHDTAENLSEDDCGENMPDTEKVPDVAFVLHPIDCTCAAPFKCPAQHDND